MRGGSGRPSAARPRRVWRNSAASRFRVVPVTPPPPAPVDDVLDPPDGAALVEMAGAAAPVGARCRGGGRHGAHQAVLLSANVRA